MIISNLRHTTWFLCTLILLSCSESAKHSEDQLNHRPAWLDEIPLVVAGGWDSEPATQRRWNQLSIDYMDAYDQRMSEETVIKLKEKGITVVLTHYFKGYGIQGTEGYMEDTRRFA